MNTLELIKTRRSTRKFKQIPLEKEKLDQIIEAGRYAPSGGNNQTTHFLVVQNREVLAKLAELSCKAFRAMEETPGMYKSMVKSIRMAKSDKPYIFHYDAPVLIITANIKSYGNNIADCSCALENMMIQANGMDLGSCWINQLKWLNEDPEILEYLRSLGLKEEERVYGALSVGYPDTESGLPVRTPLTRTGNEVTYI